MVMLVLALLALAAAIFFAGGELFAASPQTSSPAAGKTFDVVSVKVNHSGTTQSNINFTDGAMITNLPLRPVIQLAWGISQPARLIGYPDWVNTERFDIVAKGTIGNLDERREALQAMLADRFGLAAHMEQRTMPTFNLVLARGDGRLGPLFKASPLDCLGQAVAGRRGGGPPAPPPNPECVQRTGPGEVELKGFPLSTFVALLSLSQGRPVVDRTGLMGNFDIHLTFAPVPLPGRAPDPITDGRPLLVTALQEQLGMKLEASTQPEDVLIIDRVSRPDEN
jgi:uncharacterized protein (TIGR03435 family)